MCQYLVGMEPRGSLVRRASAFWQGVKHDFPRVRDFFTNKLVVPRHSSNEIPPPLCSISYPPFHVQDCWDGIWNPTFMGHLSTQRAAKLLSMQQESLHLCPTTDGWEWVGAPFQVQAAYQKLLRAHTEEEAEITKACQRILKVKVPLKVRIFS